MLNPTYLEQLPEPVIDLVSQLENEIIADLTKRIVKGNYNTPSAEWMTYKANQLRLSSSAINRIIAKNAKVREKTVRELYTEAVRLALSEDAEVYRYAIKDNIISKSNEAKLNTYFRSIPLNDTFRKGLKNTNGLMRNLTNSMAATANKMLSDAMDLAWLETVSGAFTPDEAVFKAVTDLTGKGLKVVKYDSGRNDQVDVAVRRAVRTSVNKTAGDMQLDLASEMGCDLVEVTSHLGARPSHAEWQGQVYSLSGKHPKYKPFSVTGYGTGDGLCGWNCRHSFYPYFEGLSERASIPKFTAEENLEAYELSQKQRAYERAVRQSKRELAGIDSARQKTDDPALKAKLDKQFERKSATLKNREQRLDSFCKKNGLQKDNSRVRTVGFDRSVSQKAVHAAKNYTAAKNNSGNGLTSGGNGGIINTVQTKLNDNGTISNPMNPKRYKEMKERLEKNGCTVIAAHGEDERFLIAFGAEAISDEHGIMHLGDIPSASAFFEEIIHYTQTKKYGIANYDHDGIERAAREIAANRKLLKHGKVYGFTNEDFEEISRNLKYWEESFKRKVGITYDEADFKREI